MTDTAPADQATATSDWTTPTGLGTAAARVASQFARLLPEPPAPTPAPPPVTRPPAGTPHAAPPLTAPPTGTAPAAPPVSPPSTGTAPAAPPLTAPPTGTAPAGSPAVPLIPGSTAPLAPPFPAPALPGPALPGLHLLGSGPDAGGVPAVAAVVGEAVRAARTAPGPGYVLREWGDGRYAPLYVPPAERENQPLTDLVEDGLEAWAAQCGFVGEELGMLRAAGFGRLAVLTHTDSDDPEHLLIAAKLNAAWWAADDLYADSSEMGAQPTELPPRLALAMAAMDPLPDAGRFTPPVEEALAAEPVLIALRTGIEHLSRYGSAALVQRVNYSTFAMFVSWNSYAAWRYTGEYPPAWKYLATRQHDTFYTSMTVIDAVGGYEVPAELYYDPKVRRAAFQAGTAAVLVNDLMSVTKDAADEHPVVNMVLQIAADRRCPIAEATEETVELHNRIVRDFEASHRELLAVPSPELQRFLRGLRSWMGGGFEWHNTNPRYRA
ncbi:family 2 encapsulin nanocompartment cargo protein terpene cyclase [Actinosynnema sp. NPDC050436]|uniref:family 2 encapsulin nanocompartment cargo protein terpene cyclase n=1 Tax=Actinosynnema sp. NPDC050436 TaxID=3155659 RepID=UPI0033FDFA6A